MIKIFFSILSIYFTVAVSAQINLSFKDSTDSNTHSIVRIANITCTDQKEHIILTDTSNGSLNLNIYSVSDSLPNLLFSQTFNTDSTKEVRIFPAGGSDVIDINAPASDIKIKIVDGEGQKKYDFKASKYKVDIYNLRDVTSIDSTKQSTLSKPILKDSINAGEAINQLHSPSSGFFPAVDLRSIDGLFLGVGYKFVNARASKEPSSIQKVSAMKNLNSEAVQFKYNAVWTSVFKNTDLLIDGFADIKGNILNFFGRGNETYFDDSGNFRKFYRAKFSLFQFDPALRLNFPKQFSITIGPSFQHFKLNPDDNSGRFINESSVINQYEALQEDKSHGGLILLINWDRRDQKLLPTKGVNFSMLLQSYTGLNKLSNSFTQLFPQISFYKSLDAKGKIVLAERVGAGFTTGETEFYQSAFLGSQDNLLGYRKFRFAGDNLLYNNFETRITLLDFVHKRRSVKAGLIGFYDIGRVWIENETSNKVHQGYGGGIFISPLNRILVRGVAGFSSEGMQLTFAVRQRF